MIAPSTIWKTAMGSNGYVCNPFVFLGELVGVFSGFVTLLFSPLLPTDIRAEEDCGVHMPHSLLCQYRSSAVG